MRRCRACGVDKAREEFCKRVQAKNGLSAKCRACLAQYGRDWNAKRPRYAVDRKKLHQRTARVFVRAYLETHPCVDCGEPDIVVLEFDHVRSVKDRNISDMCRRGFSLERLATEIAKCDVRCANCHRRKTVRLRETSLTYEDTHDTLPVAQEEPWQRQLIFET